MPQPPATHSEMKSLLKCRRDEDGNFKETLGTTTNKLLQKGSALACSGTLLLAAQTRYSKHYYQRKGLVCGVHESFVDFSG